MKYFGLIKKGVFVNPIYKNEYKMSISFNYM